MRTAISLKLGDRTDLADRIRQTAANANRAKHFELLKKKLKAEPANDKTRNEIIELCLLEYDSPALAAEFVAEDGDEMLRTYIPMAAKPLEDIAETPCMELGRWYLSLADIAPLKDRKVTALNRAIDYFERYLQLHEKPDIDPGRLVKMRVLLPFILINKVNLPGPRLLISVFVNLQKSRHMLVSRHGYSS